MAVRSRPGSQKLRNKQWLKIRYFVEEIWGREIDEYDDDAIQIDYIEDENKWYWNVDFLLD